jgi:L-lactate dehydrogenase complex protein LldF
MLSGPRRAGEIDGPDEFYVVLLDNGRTRLLADESKRESLYCIRCGACLNACPVYRKIGGHSFPWVYSGPIGAIITPQFKGIGHEPALPFASSLCGACAEVCPVKIDIPRVLLELRSEEKTAETQTGANRWERLAFRAFAWLMTHPRIYEMAGKAAAWFAPETNGKWLSRAPAWMNIGPMRAWLGTRDLPPAPARSFREMWRRR